MAVSALWREYVLNYDNVRCKVHRASNGTADDDNASRYAHDGNEQEGTVIR